MSTVSNPAQERTYPLDRPEEDRRFTFGLIIDIIKVLTGRGYPPITAGGDLVALQQALFGFLYAPPAVRGRTVGAPAERGPAYAEGFIDCILMAGQVPAGTVAMVQRAAEAMPQLTEPQLRMVRAALSSQDADGGFTHERLDRQPCHGAPAGFEADCGRPGPHGEHPLDTQPTCGDAR